MGRKLTLEERQARRDRAKAWWTPERRKAHGELTKERVRFHAERWAEYRRMRDAEDEAERNGWLFVSLHDAVPAFVRPNADWLEIYPWNRWMVDEQAAREKAGW